MGERGWVREDRRETIGERRSEIEDGGEKRWGRERKGEKIGREGELVRRRGDHARERARLEVIRLMKYDEILKVECRIRATALVFGIH